MNRRAYVKDQKVQLSSFHRLARHQRGFTLIELLVVMAIIGVLIGLLIPSGTNDQQAQSLFQRMDAALETVMDGNVTAGISQLRGIVYKLGGWLQASAFTADEKEQLRQLLLELLEALDRFELDP